MNSDESTYIYLDRVLLRNGWERSLLCVMGSIFGARRGIYSCILQLVYCRQTESFYLSALCILSKFSYLYFQWNRLKDAYLDRALNYDSDGNEVYVLYDEFNFRSSRRINKSLCITWQNCVYWNKYLGKVEDSLFYTTRFNLGCEI